MLFISIFLFPILAVIVAGGHGFVACITQMIFGPPGTLMS
ncbi:hypothetical protein [Microbulbifer agarilyticus]